MPVLQKQLKRSLTLISVSLLLAANTAIAATDLTMQENYLKARVKSHEQNMSPDEHASHVTPIDKSLDFHGVFYGFLPCNDCNGIKSTLSLKQKNNYLLVTQPAKESSREIYEKGKYEWNDQTQRVILTSKDESKKRQYFIKEEGTLILLKDDGTQYTGDKADSYTIRRSDTVKAREVHIH